MDMPRPRPPHLHQEITRHGKVVWYFRRDGGKRIRIRADLGSPEFEAAYAAALTGAPAPGKAAHCAHDSFAWLIDQYLGSGAWERLAPDTKRMRLPFYTAAEEAAGSRRIADVTNVIIRKAVDKRRSLFMAANWLDAMRPLFKWALNTGHVKIDPTVGVVARRPRTDGFHIWTEDEIDRFEARWPIGTHERLAMSLFLYTGLRLADVARLGCQHVRNGWIIPFRTQKTGATIEIPLLPVLADIIAASPTAISPS